jgi:hypothetical protein
VVKLTKDAQGDLSGIKGTEYHLLYALWLLLRGGAEQVKFYEGNDLLAHPIAPPKIVDSLDGPLIALLGQATNEDVWIQLKSTESPWTRSSFLPTNTKDENLLKNFVCNAVRSESEGRSWRVVLGTQGFVQRNELEEFISDRPAFSDLNKRLSEILARARADLMKAGFASSLVSESHLLALSINILSQLAKTKPMPREVLLAEIELELVSACYDRTLALQVSRALRGALLSDASVVLVPGQVYDLSWVNRVAGFPVRSQALFDVDPVKACNEANRLSESPSWDPVKYVPRVRLETSLEQFLSAPQSLFVLIGRGGSGKSWSATDWSVRVLADRIRLFVKGSALNQNPDLSGLVAHAMRPFTSADATNEILLRRFVAASRIEGKGPAVLIVDNVQVTSDRKTLSNDLAALLKECKTYGIKLVLTSQKQIWNHQKLWKEIPSEDFYVADAVSEPGRATPVRSVATIEVIDRATSRATYSFELGDFSAEEMSGALTKHLPFDRAERASLTLALPSFAALRNPYLLTRYLEIHQDKLGRGNVPAPLVSIDDLLDSRSAQLLDSAAQPLSLSLTDVQPAFEGLIRQLWDSRAEGISYAEAKKTLSPYLQEQSGSFISELREHGLLTSGSPMTVIEEPIAERLFAKFLENKHGDCSALSQELDADKDAGIVVALMRSGKHDPVQLAEELVSRDERWTKPVSDGLAQCDPRDYRVLGFLAALMHSDKEKVFLIEPADALGQLAARDKRALKFVSTMYFSPTSNDRYGGEYALGSAMEFEPKRASAAIRLKLSRASRAKGVFPSDVQKKRKQILKGALEPLSLIKNTAAADAGRKLLQRYEYLGGKNEHDLNYKFLEGVDHARGRIALYDSRVFQLLLSELQSDDKLIRYRAAVAIRGPAIEQPLRVNASLYSAMSRDPEYVQTINRILLAAYPLVSADPHGLLKALAESHLTKWDKPLSTAQVLGHLGDLCSKFPEDVHKLLPKALNAYPADDRAFITEMLSYAWWRCAEHVPEATGSLSNLATPDLSGVSPEIVPFAIRGAAIAQLGLMFSAGGEADELAGEQYFYPLGNLIFTYLNTRQFVRDRAGTILAHPEYARLRDLLLEVITKGEPVNINPLNRPIVQSVFRCVVLSLEMLAALANEMSDPMTLLTAVPRDWRALHMASQLLEAGRRDQSLIAFTETVCEEVTHGTSTMQALAEREKCLAQLAALRSDHQVALEQHRAVVDDHFFQVTGKMRGLVQLIDANPKATLTLLNKGIVDSSDEASLYFLKDKTRCWQALLVGRLYARGFDSRPIRPNEAKEWCEQVLAAVSGLSSSTHQDEYQNVYGCIRSWLNGNPERPKPVTNGERSTLRDSHALAASILTLGYEAISEGEKSINLDDVLSDRRGWIEGNLVFENDTISQSSSKCLNYVFPAVRLALIALGQRFSLEDPAARLLVDRKKVKELLATHRYVFQQQIVDDDDRKELEAAIAAFRDQLNRTPRDETLWAAYGDALVRARQFKDGDDALNRCLGLPSCSPDTRASALYNLACLEARLGFESECHDLLVRSDSLSKLDKKYTASDPDFESVRNKGWFRELTGST